LTTNAFSDDFALACQATGASIQAVETLSLEEIFVNTINHRKEAVQ
jgi:ABC-2 type transport system ATP-binding protein